MTSGRSSSAVVESASKLMAYKHHSFWQCMDTPRDKHVIESLWQPGNLPWKIWE